MKISKQARREAKQLFRSCLVGGLLDEGRALTAVRRVIQTKPRGFISILSQFERLVKLDVKRRSARVESATVLATDLQERLKAGLEKSYGAGLSFSFVQNPALIGGLRIAVGSD